MEPMKDYVSYTNPAISVNGILPKNGFSHRKISPLFLKLLNHHLRTPLVGILGLSQQLSEEILSSNEQYQCAKDIHQCGDQLLAAITELLQIISEQVEKPAKPNLYVISKKQALSRSEFSKKSKTFRVLIVEDDLIVQKVHSAMLIKDGYEVNTAENGQEAVRKVNSNEYDLILMDIRMPVMDGFAATKEIRQLEGTAKHTPIIGLTADGENTKAKCLAVGMDGFATKPIMFNDLRELIKSYLKVSTI